jgi:hypothetical protein
MNADIPYLVTEDNTKLSRVAKKFSHHRVFFTVSGGCAGCCLSAIFDASMSRAGLRSWARALSESNAHSPNLRDKFIKISTISGYFILTRGRIPSVGLVSFGAGILTFRGGQSPRFNVDCRKKPD